MNIAFDIDGVLTNYEQYQLEVAKHYFKKKYNRDIVDDAGYDLMKIYGVGKKEFHDFWARHIFTYAVRELAKSGASECFKKLASDGDTIYIITARILADQDNVLGAIMRQAVRYWLKKEGLDYEKLVFVTDDKVDAIQKYHIQVMVEDSPKNIKDLSEHIEVVCMNAKYNQGISNPHIHRVNNFDEVYECICSIREQIKRNLTDPIGPRSGKLSIDMPYRKFYNTKQEGIFFTDESIYSFIRRINDDNQENIAIDYFDQPMSFGEFFRQVEKCARALKSIGVKRGEIVTVIIPNTPEGLISFYAINKIGAVANLVHPLSAEEEVKNYLKETQTRFVIAIDAAINKLQNVIDDTSVTSVIVATPGQSMPLTERVGYKVLAFAKKHRLIEALDDISRKLSKGLKLKKNNFSLIPDSIRHQLKSVTPSINYNDKYISWASFMMMGHTYKENTLATFEPNEMAVILHTGGSTGRSKGVMLSNENVNANSIQLQYTIPHYEAHDRLLAITPIFHGFGLVDCIHTAFAVKMSVILQPQFDRKSYEEAVLKHPALILGVPSLLDQTMKLDELQDIDVPFNVFISGGAPLYRSQEEAANNFIREHNGVSPICKGGGMTEATAAFTFTMEGANKLESVGIPLPYNKVKIVNPETLEELGPNEQGEICISGPTVMLGYYKNEEETNLALKTHKDGRVWLHSGDLGYYDEDGLIYYSGRIKRMIISSGYNIYPQEIERVIMLHPDVCDVVAFGIPDVRKGYVPKVQIVLADNAKAEKVISELYALCSRHLARFAKPAEIEVVKELPKTLYNKVDFVKAEEMDRDKRSKKLTLEM